MTTSYYTFEFGDQNAGYYELTQEADSIYQKAHFKMEEYEIINIFHLKLADGVVTAFQYKEDGWVDMSKFGEDCYPSSAFPLLLEKANPIFAYQSIDESEAAVTASLQLHREGNCITETEDGETVRKFWLEAGQVIKIDWGGPISRLCTSKEEAMAGSPCAGA